MTPDTPIIPFKPIIFNSEMVRAILAGKKTITRRPLKIQPSCDKMKYYGYDDSMTMLYGEPKKDVWIPASNSGKVGIFEKPYYICPYGKPGKKLWVRETWANVLLKPLFLKANNIALPKGIHWRPSIHMPRYFSRITLEITNVRVERLQEIHPSDIVSEGWPTTDEIQFDSEYKGWLKDKFEQYWDSLYTKKLDYQWKQNPWVWVISFKDISKK